MYLEIWVYKDVIRNIIKMTTLDKLLGDGVMETHYASSI